MTIFFWINYCNLLIIIIILLSTCPYFFVCVGVSVKFFFAHGEFKSQLYMYTNHSKNACQNSTENEIIVRQ